MSQDFPSWFRAATGFEARPWQAALAADATCGDRLLRVPTGFGKTLGVAATWLWHRVVRADLDWPTRLVWTLPMRTLVEQTEQATQDLLRGLNLLWDAADVAASADSDRVGVHVLMGGADAGDWHLRPERPAILIGTQDMLLSRALNRGYGAARARWPTDFGLLSQDALWVLDEVQLMDVGLATAAQLASFRRAQSGPRPTHTWAMSATLQRQWLKKSPDTADWVAGLVDQGLRPNDLTTDLWAGTTKSVQRLGVQSATALATRVMAAHRAQLQSLGGLSGTAHDVLTLVVCNTVQRACELYRALQVRALQDQAPHGQAGDAAVSSVQLLHSRFRGQERDAWTTRLLSSDAPQGHRIIVATQVVEAGVDLSADLLFTELCPWASLVQRLGRLARRGGTGRAVVVDLDRDRQSAPYDPDALDAAWGALTGLADGSPRGLADYEGTASAAQITALYPYDPPNLLLDQEVQELFDTTPDLSGADLDVSRFIRSGDQRDVSICWVDPQHGPNGKVSAPPADRRPPRAALCTVPFLAAQAWLCGKGTATFRPPRLSAGVHAWVWDYLDGQWRVAARADLWPGQVVLVDRAVGGYHPNVGFDPKLKGKHASIPLVPLRKADLQDQADASQDHEDLSQAAWQTIGFHGAAVARAVGDVSGALGLDPHLAKILNIAGRWHDLGKAHPVFQGAIVSDSRPSQTDLAKAPSGSWRHGRYMFRHPQTGELRRGFRHELVSTLGLFAVLERHAGPQHPSRLGRLAPLVPDARQPTSDAAPTPLEQEVLDLSADDFDLLAYLVCCHHGRLRARLHASPADQDCPDRRGQIPIRGVRDGDVLPQTTLADAQGGSQPLAAAQLHLDLATLGLSGRSGRSWTDRVDGLLTRHGPFMLAWLEALIRSADVRASRDASLHDPDVSLQDRS